MHNSIFDFVAELLQEYPDAVRFLHELFHMMHVWDDLIDKDKPVDDATINSAFTSLLVHVPANPFYQRFFAQLHPLISVATLDWLAANELERTGNKLDEEIAFITRSSYAALILKTLELCRGYAFAQRVAADVRRTIHQEGFDAYRVALANQKGV